MSSISGVSSSKSIYGNRNVLTGLASGMDTESMIENAISAYKLKISGLQQKRTKVEWQQESYRSIVNKMSVFADKYTSYRSSNNLMSASFFNQSVKTVAKGKYADKISATGRASSDVQIDRVLQMATAATYKLSGSEVDGMSSKFDGGDVVSKAGGVMSLDEMRDVSKLDGSLTLAYGGSNSRSYLDITFDKTKTYKNAEELAAEINRQLGEQSISIGSTTYTGEDLLKNVVRAEVGKDGNITFSDAKDNGVYISGATGSTKDLLLRGEEPGSEADSRLEKLWIGKDTLKTDKMSTMDYLSSQKASMEITLDGVTKTIDLPGKDDIAKGLTSTQREKAYIEALQANINKAFGDGKLTVSDAKDGTGIQFQFTAAKGSTFSVKSTEGKALGFGDGKQVTSYLNTGKTLGELLGKEKFANFEVAKALDANGKPTSEDAKDANGDPLYSFKVNGKEVGQFNANSTLQDVMDAMNSNSDSEVKVSYSKLTNELSFTAKETGAGDDKIKFEGFSAELFGTPGATSADPDAKKGTYTKGQNAIFEATVNGTSLGQMERSSNTVEMDGMSITLKGTFGYKTDDDGNVLKDADGKAIEDKAAEAVTFETSSDSDKIVDVVKKMVEDYNAMVTEIKNAYSTMPLQRSSGAYYEPLTDEDREGMSESAIEKWEENAKTGILFGDRDLANLYDRLTSAVNMTGEIGATLRSAGITVNYSNGLTTLDFNETDFRAALEKDPDKVREAFTASTESGAKANGLMQALKQPLDMYGKTTGGKGILVEKAGSALAPTTLYNNTIQNQLNDIDDQIERWQDKMSDKVDYYTNQFSRLEQLIQQMNSQSSYFAQISGG